MPKRSRSDAIRHLQRVHGEAKIDARWLCSKVSPSSREQRQLVAWLRRQLIPRPQILRARTLRREGKSVAQIASALRVTPRTVQGWLGRRFGVPGRRALERPILCIKGLAYVTSSSGRRLPIVVRQGVCWDCGGKAHDVAKSEVSWIDWQLEGYCQSCKRRTVFTIAAERHIRFEDAKAWERSRDARHLREAFERGKPHKAPRIPQGNISAPGSAGN